MSPDAIEYLRGLYHPEFLAWVFILGMSGVCAVLGIVRILTKD